MEKNSIKVNDLTLSNYLMMAAAVLETILGIPVLGGLVVIMTVWTILIVTLALNVVSLVYAIKEKNQIVGPILGIAAAVVGWIPFVALIMHIIAAVFNWMGAFNKVRGVEPETEVKSKVETAEVEKVEVETKSEA